MIVIISNKQQNHVIMLIFSYTKKEFEFSLFFQTKYGYDRKNVTRQTERLNHEIQG